MAEDKVELRDVNFRQVFSWSELFRTFQVALDPKKLLLAAAGILVMSLGWWVLAALFYGTQAKPEWKDYPPANYTAATPELQTELAWKDFKEARRQWNLLHRAAGGAGEFTDAADLAENAKEYEAIKPRIDAVVEQLSRDNSRPITETIIGKKYTVGEKPYGALTGNPFAENRGPNPYLMVTDPGSRQWEAGQFGEWFLSVQVPVLVEPLRKFFYPVIHLLSPATSFMNRLYFLLVTLVTLGTWALFGGAITRMAVVQVARNDKVGMMEALRFVKSRYTSYLSAPLFPLLFVVFMVVLLSLFGLFFMIPLLGDIGVAGLFYPLVLLAGVAMAVVLVGLVGWPMMYATISAEGSDSFDAISRSYSYVYQSPWNYIWYGAVSCVYGAAVIFFVGFIGSLVVYLGKWGVEQTPFIAKADREPHFLYVYAPESFGWRTLLLDGATVNGQPVVVDRVVTTASGETRVVGRQVQPTAYKSYVASMTWYNTLGAYLVTLWIGLAFLMVLGFGYSYFWCASSIIYLLMRRRVDDTDLDEVYLEEDETEAYQPSPPPAPAPAPAGAPPGSTPLQMVEAPALRTPAPAPAPAGAASPEAPAGGNKPQGDGASS